MENIDIYSAEGLNDLERRLDGIVLGSMTTTEVAKKDLPDIPEPAYINAPKTLEDAVQRILQLEMLLEDMSRAVEIAQITGQINLVESFYNSANEYLKDKIQIQQPDLGEFKITLITDEESDKKKV